MNKKLLFPLVFAGFAWSVFAQNTIISPAIPVDKVIEDKVEKLLEKMTLEEKIGQMTELTIDVLTDKKTTGQPGFTFDEAMLDTVIGKYKVIYTECTLWRSTDEGGLGHSYQKNSGRIDKVYGNSLRVWR